MKKLSNMKKHLRLFFLFTISFLLFSLKVFSQKNDSLIAMNRKFKNEIGIDFKDFFHGAVGTSLIWKRKKTEHLIALKTAKNYRFQVGLNGTIPIVQKTTQNDSTNGYYENFEQKLLYLQVLVGIEKINFFGRFNSFMELI